MSVQHYKNGQLSIIAGAGGIGGGGGECDCENKTFTGTTAEVEQAIADGVIKDDYIVNITDDVTAGAADIDVLDSYDEIMVNTEEGKAAGALGVKEGFEKINILNSYEEIMANTENDKIAGATGVREGFEAVDNYLNGMLIVRSFAYPNSLKTDPNNAISITIPITTPEGYTPVGIVGFNLISWAWVPVTINITSNTACFIVFRNVGTSETIAANTVNVKVLFAKIK